MEYSFPRYLLAKQSVDDRALNKDVFEELRSRVPREKLSVIEVGAGIGTMLARLLRLGLFTHANYTALDKSAECVDHAAVWLPQWAAAAGLTVESNEKKFLQLSDQTRQIRVNLELADVLEFVNTKPRGADLLIAHAVLDLFPLPQSLPDILSLTNGLAWLTLNFDGMTIFEPAIDPELDEKIENLYHRTMDTRRTGGDSRTGRHLFEYLNKLGVKILRAGSSDWVVHPVDGNYQADEAYFLFFILHFIEESLSNQNELGAADLSGWIDERRSQVEHGELVYIAHQMDYLVEV